MHSSGRASEKGIIPARVYGYEFGPVPFSNKVRFCLLEVEGFVYTRDYLPYGRYLVSSNPRAVLTIFWGTLPIYFHVLLPSILQC